MTTIDHRILIPAGPEAVWEYVSDITHNPDWQIDCAEVIFLTSRREGPGVRWRYSAPNGHEFVVAVTAWYNGLGYEYYFVDGVPFKENKGRIRLQEIPEGTIVQWTFTYELGGLFGGMRDTLGISRQVNGTISESLKTLYQKIKQTGAASRPHEAKSLMRDAPNVDARSAYQPRHPSIMAEEEKSPAAPKRIPVEPPIREGDGQRIRVIAEPPIAEDDTRKRKAVAPPPLPEEAIPADIEGEPDFLKQIVDLSRFEPPRSPSDTQPRRPVTPEEIAQPKAEARPGVEETEPLAVTPPAVLPGYPAPIEEPTAPAADLREETQPDYVSPASIYERPTPPPAPEPDLLKPVEETTPAPEATAMPVEPAPAEPPAVEPKVEPEMPVETPAIEPAPEAIQPAEPPVAEFRAGAETPVETPAIEPAPETVRSAEPPVIEAKEEPKPSAEPPAPLEPKATSETASIWEIFGVPRPSETQETEAVSTETRHEATPAAPVPAPVSETAAPVSDPQAVIREMIALPPGSTRAGLRIALRRKLIFVRRP